MTAAAAAPRPAPAPVASRAAVAAEWQSVHRGLGLTLAGVRTYLFAALLAFVGLVLWVWARDAVSRIPLGQVLLALVFALPASFVAFIASALVAGGRLWCLGVPGESGLRPIAILASAGAILALVDAFVIAMPLLLFPLAIVAHAAAEIGFLLFLSGVGARFGDTALAANAKRFLVIGGIGGAIALGACVVAARLILADEAAAARIVAENVEVIRGIAPGGAGPGFVGGLVGGFLIVWWLRTFEEPRLRGVGLLFVPGALFWAGGAGGIATGALGLVASAATTFLVAAYLALVEEARACVSR